MHPLLSLVLTTAQTVLLVPWALVVFSPDPQHVGHGAWPMRPAEEKVLVG